MQQPPRERSATAPPPQRRFNAEATEIVVWSLAGASISSGTSGTSLAFSVHLFFFASSFAIRGTRCTPAVVQDPPTLASRIVHGRLVVVTLLFVVVRLLLHTTSLDPHPYSPVHPLTMSTLTGNTPASVPSAVIAESNFLASTTFASTRRLSMLISRLVKISQRWLRKLTWRHLAGAK